jgi:two-component system, NtrC family, response regulator AtoC
VTEPKDTTHREIAPGSRREARVSLVFYFRDGAKIVEPQVAPLTFGRSWPADIVVDDASVSRAHARFFVAPDGGVCFEDLGSTNGTRLNGVPTPRGRLTPTDELRLGDVTCGLHVLTLGPGVSGLLGYDKLLELLQYELARAKTFGRTAALLMVAARAPGHPMRKWVPSLLEKLRPVDRAAVYASDAVLVALPEATHADADALGAQIVGQDAALRYGAATLPESGTTVDELLDAARTAMVRGARAMSVPPPSGRPFVMGERSRPVWDLVDRVARAVLPVLVLGETGTGKEVVAMALHHRSARAEGPMRSVNCAAIPQNLVESVLFGHEKGAFTGAEKQTRGVFEQAHGGTLFLDEVGELPAGAQAALLRVLETKKLTRLGGDREIAVDVRVVAATHRDLEAMGREGTFRSDLYYRLHGMTIAMPPLRERKDEIAPLAEQFLRDAARDNARAVRAFDPAAMAALLRWSWPGNVRELKNVVERGVVIARGDVVTLDDLPERVRETTVSPDGSMLPPVAPVAVAPVPVAVPVPAPAPVEVAASSPPIDPSVDYKERLRLEMQRYERDLIVNALAAAGGNVTAAAQALKIPVRTLTHKMQALGIKKRFESD